MNRFLAILIISLCTCKIFAQEPVWADQDYRESRYPHDKFYVGFSSPTVSKNEDMQKALNTAVSEARARLSESININILNKTEYFRKEIAKNADKYSLSYNFNSDFESKTLSTTENEISDLQQMEPVYDKKSGKVFALVYVEKNEILLKNQEIVNMNILSVSKIKSNAASLIDQSMESGALELLSSTEASFNEIKQAQSMIFCVSGSFYKKEEYFTLLNDIYNLHTRIENSVKLNLETACKMIVHALRNQTSPDFNNIIVLDSMNYENSSFASSLSQRLRSELGRQMVMNKYPMAKQVTDLGNDYVTAEGDYFIENYAVKVIVSLIGQPSGKILATASGYVSKKWLDDNGINYIPDEIRLLNEKIDKRKKLLADEMHSGDIELSAWLNKYETLPVFQEGDTMNLYLRVNKPCYVRGLYFQADGVTTSLFDDFHVVGDMVGKPLDLADLKIGEFIMGGSLGKEDLMLAVSDKPFVKLNIEKKKFAINGKDYSTCIVTDDDFTAISTTKGIINLMNQDNKGKIANYAQKHIQLIVVKKGR